MWRNPMLNAISVTGDLDELLLCTCYSPDRPANKSGFRYSPDDASVYLQHTRNGPISLIAINIQCTCRVLTPPKPLFCSRSRLDRLLDKRSVVPASWGYRHSGICQGDVGRGTYPGHWISRYGTKCYGHSILSPSLTLPTNNLGALVVTHAMLRRLTSWRCIIIIIKYHPGYRPLINPTPYLGNYIYNTTLKFVSVLSFTAANGKM